MKKIFLLFLTLSIIFAACETDDSGSSSSKPDTTKIDYSGPQLIIVSDKLFSVPSPLQASILVKDNNIPFDQDLLNETQNYTKYLTSFKQALNIGVYGANLGNLFLYDQLSQSAEYFNVIKKLSEQVGVMNSINESVLDRIEKNDSNKDSMLFIVSEVYRQIDSYLLENDQEEIGVLIITGGWIESIYLLIKIIETDRDPAIIYRIGEQKKPLSNIIELLQPYYGQKSEEFDELLESLVDLSIIFDGIEATYVYEPPEVDPQNKTTIIKSSTTYDITDEQLDSIAEKIIKIRTSIIAE